MLGKAFESLMRTRERRASGAFYTPQALVARATHAALTQALAGPGIADSAVEAVLAGSPADERTSHALRERIGELRVLDPACGSGAFLVHALEEMAALTARLGDGRPIASIRRELLTRSIFGVDTRK
jgi:type I restriction-modification system DNA methylase subunit